MEQKFEIRNATEKEVEEILVEWSAEEGWNPGLHDGTCYYAADPKGFFIGFLDDKPIACVSAVAYNHTFGFMGFFIVKPEYRGQEYGLQIGKAGFDYLTNRTIGLDGVVAQQSNYMKSGFKVAWNNYRMRGKAVASTELVSGIIPFSDELMEEVEILDACSFSISRPSFFHRWVKQPDHTVFVCMRKGRVSGYGVIRKCREGYKIGPLIADNQEQAESLYLALCSSVEEGATIYLDMPELNKSAVHLASKYNMEKVFETARMYVGNAPLLKMSRIYGITSFEIG
ncbi:MAG: GNAT family N-acetyltransferase [Bacteroidales bacterium]|nr:GNAT family N-acetyltransferase [Bacteroidales bacterium]